MMINRRSFVVVAAAAAVSGTAEAGVPGPQAPTPSTPPSSPSTEVSVRLEQQRAAWNRGDLESFCADYSDDCVFLSPTGLSRGRVEVLERYTRKYGAAKETMGTLSFEVVDEEIGADMVALAMRWKLSWPHQTDAAGLTLIVWHKINNKWRLTQDASM